MFSSVTVISAVCLYVAFLFIIALWVEKGSKTGRKLARSPAVYSLALAVYCTSWTFYGSVGKAASSGMLFLTIYLGPTMAIVLWWFVLRKLVRLKTINRTTSIADFISSRYGKSQSLAAIATMLALIGTTPYIALQLKAVNTTFSIITGSGSAPDSWIQSNVGPIVVVLMALFTIVFGVRKLDPTERHEGMVTALAVECVVKLFAFMAAGIFVTYFMYDGFGDIFTRLSASPFKDLLKTDGSDVRTYMIWSTYLLISMSAILFLPRQFHVAVVENSNENHIKTAVWMFPLYMLLINIFVVPIAAGGLLKGYSVQQADTFVLSLPLNHGPSILAMLVFIGGFSAATGMIMVSSMTTSTMMTNHLFLPVIERIKVLAPLRRHLLKVRWFGVIAILFIGYAFQKLIGDSHTLVNMGIISFVAVLQFAPPIIGGLFWRKAGKAGALLGLSSGFFMWCYTMLLPSFARSGWLPDGFLDYGPFGINYLKPESLFGLTGVDPLVHTVFWTMFFNIGLYILGSLFAEKSKNEVNLANDFVDIMEFDSAVISRGKESACIKLEEKLTSLTDLLGQYLTAEEAGNIINKSLIKAGIKDEKIITIADLAQLTSEAENFLSGFIGAAAAHQAFSQSGLITKREKRELSEMYAEILADMSVSPEEIQKKIDYYKDRDMLMARQSAELERKVKERTRDLEAAAELGHAANSILDPEKLRQQVVDMIQERFGLYYVGLYLLDDTREWALLHAYSTETVKVIMKSRYRTKIGEGIIGESIANARASVADDTGNNKTQLSTPDLPDTRSEIALPLRIHDIIVGAIDLRSSKFNAFNKDNLPVFQTLTDQIAMALNNAQLYNTVEGELTERRRTETELEEAYSNLKLFRDLINQSHEAIYVCEPATARFLDVNNAACKMLGYSEEEFLKMKVIDIQSALPDSYSWEMHVETLKEKESSFIEGEHKRKDGSTLPVEVSINYILRGKKDYIVAVARDITSRQKAEKRIEEAYAELKSTQSQMLQREKMASVGQLAAGVAHEINNPMGYISSNLNTLNKYTANLLKFIEAQSKIIESSQYEECRREINALRKELKLDYITEDLEGLIIESLDGAERVKVIVQNLKSFSRIDEAECKLADINECIDSTLNIVWNELKYKASVQKDYGELPPVKCYPQQLNQVIMNLLVNAGHSIEKEGEIIIKTWNGDKTIKVSISDNGCGIPEDKIGRIFEPFFTTKEIGEGTGLGLSICYDIVKKHNGDITVESNPGEGTTFTIQLPVVSTI